MKPQRLPALGLLVGGFVLLGAALTIVNPLWEAPDEPDHFQYVKFLVEQHRLPRLDEQLPYLSLEPTTESKQPPLYYIVEAPLVAGIDLNQNPAWLRNPYFTWSNHPSRYAVALHTLAETWPYHGMVLGAHIMRLISVLLGAATVGVIYFTALAVTDSPRLALLSAAIAALTPCFFLSSASINNDNGVALASALALLAAVKVLRGRLHEVKWLILFVCFTTLALLTKVNGAILLPVGAALLGIAVGRRLKVLQKVFSMSLFMAMGLCAVTATWLVAFEPRYQLLATLKAHPPASATMLNSLAVTYMTYWGSFGSDAFRLPASVYVGFGLALFSAAAGWVLCIRRWRTTPDGRRRLRQLAVLAFAFMASLLAIVYRGGVVGADVGASHARFLLPVLPATSLLLAVGLDNLPDGFRRFAFQMLFGILICIAGYSLYALPRLFGPRLPTYNVAYEPVDQSAIEHPLNVAFDRGIELLGWSAEDQTSPGGRLHVRLFWQANSKPDRDYSAFLRFSGTNGTLFFTADHSPGATDYVLPTDWPVGQPVPDEWLIGVPMEVSPGPYQIIVGLYDPAGGQPLGISGSSESSAVIGTQLVSTSS